MLPEDMFKSTEEMTARPRSPSWREQQQLFSKEKVEFIQDQRIIDFFEPTTIFVIGETEYFNKKFKLAKQADDTDQCLMIINKLTTVNKLCSLLNNVATFSKKMKRVCITINKFLLYNNINQDEFNDDYDQALFELVKKFFPTENIKYHYVENLKGKHFNFASPCTQFFITR